MVISINQPAYLPWLGYFHRMMKSDQHVVLDHVQFEKNSFTNRNKISSREGWLWLTVPVLTKGKFGNLTIHEIEINNSTNWRKKHWNAMLQNYNKAKFFEEFESFFEDVYKRDWNKLIDICEHINKYLLTYLEFNNKVVYSSSLNLTETKDDLVLKICKIFNANMYLSGSIGREYLQVDKFQKENIQVVYQDYIHPEYPQLYDKEFKPFMSIIDLLFNHGKKSKDILFSL